MSHENSMQIGQSQAATDYRQYVESKRNKGIMERVVNTLAITFVALIILTGVAFAIANYSPTTYAQAKDIIFEKIDIEKLTGRPDAINKEYLDSWLILNSENQQGNGIVQDENAEGESTPEEQLKNQFD